VKQNVSKVKKCFLKKVKLTDILKNLINFEIHHLKLTNKQPQLAVKRIILPNSNMSNSGGVSVAE
jgi:hypothetical protein